MDGNKKRENFKRIAERRTNEILDKINSFKNFSKSIFQIFPLSKEKGLAFANPF